MFLITIYGTSESNQRRIPAFDSKVFSFRFESKDIVFFCKQQNKVKKIHSADRTTYDLHNIPYCLAQQASGKADKRLQIIVAIVFVQNIYLNIIVLHGCLFLEDYDVKNRRYC